MLSPGCWEADVQCVSPLVVPSLSCSASTPWLMHLTSSAGPQEGRRWDRCSSPSESPSWPSCGQKLTSPRQLPGGVKALKKRRGCRSVVPGMGRGCYWKEPELEEEERWLVVKTSHGGMRKERKRNPAKAQLYLLVNWIICNILPMK